MMLIMIESTRRLPYYELIRGLDTRPYRTWSPFGACEMEQSEDEAGRCHERVLRPRGTSRQCSSRSAMNVAKACLLSTI